MEKIEQEIETVEVQITQVGQAIAAAEAEGREGGPREGISLKREQDLREEKRQLREEKRQLREKELLLLQKFPQATAEKIERVKSQIEAVEAQVRQVDQAIVAAVAEWKKRGPRESIWVEREEALRKEKHQMREDKRQLREMELLLQRLPSAGAGPSTSGDRAKGQQEGVQLRFSGTGQWSSAIADSIRRALDPTFRLLDSQGNLNIPCWTPAPDHPQGAHIKSLAIPQWPKEPSLLLHALPEKEKGRSAAGRLMAFIHDTRTRFGGQDTQLGRATFGLGVSGCGKTRTALEALCGGFGFYLNFSTAEEPCSRVLKAAVERFRQRFQKQLTDLITAGNQEGLQVYRVGKLDDAIKLVVRILLGEVLCLERFLKHYGPAATPKKYLMMQLIGLGDLEDWLVDVWSCLFDLSLEELKNELQRAVESVKQMTGQHFLLVVVDEAHFGLKSLEGHFPNAENTEGRSLLNAWVRSLDDAAFKGFHFLFTGTRLGIAEHDSLATAIGKGPGVPVIFSDYGVNSPSQARSFAMEYIPDDDCEELLWELVGGRYRFSVELTKLRLEDARLTWEGAASTLKKRHTGDAPADRTLIGRLTALESKSNFYPDILHSLKGLVTDRYVMGRARAQYRKNLDLVELGFCHLVQVKDNEGDEDEEEGGAEVDEGKGLWRMDMCEPLAAVVGRVYLERRGRWKQDNVVEQLMLELDLPSPIGLLWDVYMPAALQKFFSPDKLLADHPLLASIRNDLPESFFSCPQIVCVTEDGTVSKVAGIEGYRVRRGSEKEGFRFVDWVKDPQGITFLPEDGAGPDDANFVQLGEAKKELWFEMAQGKLRPDYDLGHALRTVTLDMLYSGHSQRQELVRRLKEALEEKGVNGIIRIVAAFPSTKTATTKVLCPKDSKTRKEDFCTVQIGVSAENAHHFFGEEHLKVLRSLKDMKKRVHSEIE